MAVERKKGKKEPREEFKALGAAEFFERYPELMGYSNPARAIFQTVKEMLDNALDAAEIAGILPKVLIHIQEVDAKKKIYKITVDDNGIGVPYEKAPYAFGRVFFSSKYVERQTRGAYGLGIKGALIVSQKQVGEPMDVITAPIVDKDHVYRFKLMIDINKNEPNVRMRGSWTKVGAWHGTRVSVLMLGDWKRGKSRTLEYIKRTAIIAPYADITVITPDGRMIRYPRRAKEMPPPPKEVKPHPKGVDLELLKRIIANTPAKTIYQMLREEFQAIGPKTASELLKMADIEPSTSPKELHEEQLKRLIEAMQAYKKFRAPSADALSPIGEKLIKIGLKTLLKPEFVTAVTRKPSSYAGHPFIVEVGLAYGGEIQPSDTPILLRYANKTPLLYNERSDVSWKVVSEIDWKNYKVSFPAPLVVLVHIASTKVPFKEASKDAITDAPEIEREIRLAIQEAARKLKRYIIRKKKEEERMEKIVTLMKYIPEIVRSLSILSIDPEKRKKTVDEKLLEEKLKEIIAKELGIPKEKLPDVVIEID